MIWKKDSIFYSPPEQRGIGDNLIFSRLPELYWRDFGQKFRLVVNDKYGIWAANPFVEIITPCKKAGGGWWYEVGDPSSFISIWGFLPTTRGEPVFKVSAHFTDNVPKNIKPTLYQDYLDKVNFNKVALCITGVIGR
jgi:hypothetical protein